MEICNSACPKFAQLYARKSPKKSVLLQPFFYTLMQKICLFIDRDGTLIREPDDEQVDSLDKLEFVPNVLCALRRIAEELDFELVMVTNQDGLGTPAFPEKDFWIAQNKMLKTLENERIIFDDVCIDRTLEHEHASTRKPNTGMLSKYIAEGYDLANSYVIGDRLSDVQLAQNLGAKAILLGDESYRSELVAHRLDACCALLTSDWLRIYDFLKCETRTAIVTRKTAETDIVVHLDLDGIGHAQIGTGIGFFDHLLEQIARHGSCDLSIACKGDLHVDEHHSVEDVALALGEALLRALGSKRGIERYGFVLPMDDCLAQVTLDFGGRPWLVFEAEFRREKIGELPTELLFHFFKSLSDAAKMNISIKAEGDNEHHKAEAIFKAFARAMKSAVRRNAFAYALPSTKGTL